MSGNVISAQSLATHGRVTILVVEDDVITRMATSEELRAHDYSIIEAASADEALSVLRGPTRIDLVLTDMKMPGALDGADLARHIRTEFPFMKVVMISGHVPAPELHQILDGYLPKPVAPTELATCVQSLTPARLP